MKITMKKDGKYIWIALKDNNGMYHNIYNEDYKSKSLILVGFLYTKEQALKIKGMLKKEGHK